jgi:hypothetical protein
MTTATELIEVQAERYADTAYFPPVEDVDNRYVGQAALEFSKRYGDEENLKALISVDQSRNLFDEVTRAYMLHKNVRQMALGIFVSAHGRRGDALLTVPWVIDPEKVASFAVNHGEVGSEITKKLGQLSSDGTGPIFVVEKPGFVLSIDEEPPLFIIDSYRVGPKSFFTSDVQKSLAETTKLLPPITVMYNGHNLHP